MLNNMNNHAVPTQESKFSEAIDRITSSKDKNELKTAIDDAVIAMKDYFDFQPLEKIKESVIAMNKNPEDMEIRSRFHENFDRFLYEGAVEDGRYVSSRTHKDDYYYAKKLRAKIIDENKISSQTEMVIVDMAVIAYFRYLRISSLQIQLVSQIASITGKDLQPKVNLLKQ